MTRPSRLSATFVGLVNEEFRGHGGILEKCDLVQRVSDVSASIADGYAKASSTSGGGTPWCCAF